MKKEKKMAKNVMSLSESSEWPKRMRKGEMRGGEEDDEKNEGEE